MSERGVGGEQQGIGEVTEVAQKASSAGAQGKRGESGGGSVTGKREAIRDEPHSNGGSNKKIRRSTNAPQNNTNEFLDVNIDEYESSSQALALGAALEAIGAVKAAMNLNLEERVELLETKLNKILSKPDQPSPMPPPQPQMAPSIDGLRDDDKLRLVQEELTLLREENEKLRADNIMLRKLFHSPILNHVVVDEEGGDRVSTDSGGGSGCESVTPVSLT